MKQINIRRSLVAAFMGISMIAGGIVAPKISMAQTTVHKRNFVQRHPTMTSVAAGYAAYKVAKNSGKRRAAMGGSKNWAQRHPFLTGMGAGMATHRVIKKSIHH